MNLNTLLLTNIQSSPYFKVNLYELKTYHEVIDEIYYKVSEGNAKYLYPLFQCSFIYFCFYLFKVVNYMSVYIHTYQILQYTNLQY